LTSSEDGDAKRFDYQGEIACCLSAAVFIVPTSPQLLQCVGCGKFQVLVYHEAKLRRRVKETERPINVSGHGVNVVHGSGLSQNVS
jgi:hypothetical protein